MKLHLSKGFTLIEIMIVVAIIGILAAVAIPVYQTHVAKSQVARVMSETAGLRSLVEACVNEGKKIIGSGESECDPGAVGSTLIDGASQTGTLLPIGHGVPQVVIAANGSVTIVARFGNSAMSLFSAQTLTWQRVADGDWNCSTTVDLMFRPKGCDL